jgi:anti-anti-sigma factor
MTYVTLGGQDDAGQVLPLRAGPRLVVGVAGEADVGTAAQLRDELVRCLRCRPQVLVVDLRDLDFCDLHGLDALDDATDVAHRAGITVALRGASVQLTWLWHRFSRHTGEIRLGLHEELLEDHGPSVA